jgi:ABC-2 type transport system ATP-binding protein
MEATIEVSGLRKRFGPTVALDGTTFTVQPGQVTGFVGPTASFGKFGIIVAMGRVHSLNRCADAAALPSVPS